MKILVTDNYTGDWADDYAAAKLIEVSQNTDISQLNVCAVQVYSAKAGDTFGMLTAATSRINKLYPEPVPSGLVEVK